MKTTTKSIERQATALIVATVTIATAALVTMSILFGSTAILLV